MIEVIEAISEFKQKKSSWSEVKLPDGEGNKHVRNIVGTNKLHANCLNNGECCGEAIATLMIPGNICSRSRIRKKELEKMKVNQIVTQETILN